MSTKPGELHTFSPLFPSPGTDASFPAAPITITNNNNDPNLELLIIEFNARVGNIATNQDATVLANKFEVKYKDEHTGQTIVSTSEPVNVLIVEPKLRLLKDVNPTSVVQGATVTYTITIKNTGTARAFDVLFTDPLPTNLINITPPSLTAFTPGCLGQVIGQNVSMTCLSPGFGGLPVGSVMNITYQAVARNCPATVKNQAMVTWTSLPGPNGTVINPTGSSTGASGANNGERNGVTPSPLLNDYKAIASAAVEVACK